MTMAKPVTAHTDAGMLCLWSPAAFSDVSDYDRWESRVNERLDDAIRQGEVVPVNIQSDGAYGVRVAFAPDGFTKREIAHLAVVSEPYLFVTADGATYISGIEGVGDADQAPIKVVLTPGRHVVHVAMVAWNDEPGMQRADGSPHPDALADFVVMIAPEVQPLTYRTREQTFDPPE